MLHMVALLAELERWLIVERTKAGQQAARRRRVNWSQTETIRLPT